MMPLVQLYDHQKAALEKMHNGCVLCGGVGSGKSRTALAYYYIQCGGEVRDRFQLMASPQSLYIITTARKRDTNEWISDMSPFLLGKEDATIDSWNNIGKYADVTGAFFILDEQRVVGNGAWVKAFLKIAKHNNWILLSATPGDKWLDYIPVFIANGYYKNRTEFYREHVVRNSYTPYFKVERYINTGRLIRQRREVLVDMTFERPATKHYQDVFVDYDPIQYHSLFKTRWDIWENKPIENASELVYALRKAVNSDESRVAAVKEIVSVRKKAIIFYNYNYELEILKNIDYGDNVQIAEWNGKKHEPLPEGDSWVYLVQYTAGSEGWNCVTTDTIIFYSLNYSYRTMTQASGRIDRLNTPFKDLYYYRLKSRSGIDVAIVHALKSKKTFNESAFLRPEK